MKFTGFDGSCVGPEGIVVVVASIAIKWQEIAQRKQLRNTIFLKSNTKTIDCNVFVIS